MDDQEPLLGAGEPPRHRVAQRDRVGATGPVLSHHGDTKDALEQGTILDPHSHSYIAQASSRSAGAARSQGDDPLLKMAQARLEQAPTLPG